MSINWPWKRNKRKEGRPIQDGELALSTDAGLRDDVESLTLGGKPIRVIAADLRGQTYYVQPGDCFRMTFTDTDGSQLLEHAEDIHAQMVINRAVMFEIRDELGFRHAICGAFGEAG